MCWEVLTHDDQGLQVGDHVIVAKDYHDGHGPTITSCPVIAVHDGTGRVVVKVSNTQALVLETA